MFQESTASQKPIPPLLTTMTGESYQPVRIYYQVGQKNAVLGRFKRLRCVDSDREKNRWAWLYSEEAKGIEFQKSYKDIPKQYRPIVLGYFSFNGDKELRLDVRSFERAIEAISFFDRKINRRLAKLTSLKVVNKLFPATLDKAELSEHHATFFEQRQAINHRDELEKLEEIAANYATEEEQQEVAFSYLEKHMKQVLPEVEELDTHFYEDGIESIAMCLRVRYIEAMEHWKGNKNFSQFDIMNTLLQNSDEANL